MHKKTIIGVAVMLITIITMLVVYKVKEDDLVNRIPLCFPTGEIYPYKDANGNIKYDSVYHTIADFKLTDQNGNTITNQTIKGKVYVSNFFFCTCPSICPKMTNSILLLQDEFINEDGVAFLSHTIFPENDSIPVLKSYEQRYHINGKKWHLLTGSRQQLYDLSKRSYYLGVSNDSPDEFQHSEKLVLVDNHRIIRGFYDGTKSEEVDKLKKDIKAILREVKIKSNNN